MSDRASVLDADAAGRRAAQTQFEGTLVLEAGAGTGKTTTLVARVLAWSLDRGWRTTAERVGEEASGERIAAEVLRGIVAITFTEAGAAEMATRVAAALAQLSSGGDSALKGFEPDLLSLDGPEVLGRRAHHLLGALDHLTVETIHAFCRRLLASYPLAAGLHPELRIDPDLRLTEEIVYEVVEAAVRRAYARPRGSALADLAAQGQGPDRLVETLVGLRSMGLEARALEVDPLSPTAIAALADRLQHVVEIFVAAGGSELRRVTSGNKAAAIADAIDRTRQSLEQPPADLTQLGQLIDELAEDWDAHFAKLGSWRHGTYTKGESSVLEPHGAAFPAAAGELRSMLRHLTRMHPQRLDRARRALAPLLAECERQAAARGILTFSDLLARAHALLVERADLRRREQKRIQQLMVDEFQDTDPLQSEIVRLLALDGPKAGRPGLFLVGDPKQSIFGWRDADLAAYEGFVTEALAQGGARYRLVRNFRSDPPVLEEVTAIVAPVMEETAGLQPPFVGLEPHHSGSRLEGTHWSPVEYWVSWATSGAEGGPATLGEETAELEAAAIARDARALHDEAGVRWSEVALLFRSTHRMDAYLAALRDAGVPFIVTRDKHYYRRKEIIDAAALVRAVVDPLDHLSLVTFLRSASAGLPDAALIPLWQDDFPRLASAVAGPSSPALKELLECVDRAAAQLPDDIPGIERIAGWQHSVAAALEALAVLRRSFRCDTAADFIDRLRHLSLIEVTEAARYQGKFRLANLDRFFRRLEQAMVERGNDMLAILRTLRRSLKEAPDAQEAPPKDSGEDAVQVLTVHKAKGLEFDHVYVPQMHALHRHDNDLKLFDVDRRWRGSEEPQYCLLSSATPRWYEVVERAHQIEAMESVRLLYVALTRARQRVVLLGRWPAQIEPRSAAEARSQLDLVHSRRGLASSPGELAERAQAEECTWLDESGIRWRFLGRAAGRATPRRRDGVPTWLPTAEGMAAEKAALETRSTEAARRMERPRQTVASSEAARRLAQLAGHQEPDVGGRRALLTRDLAMVVGTTIHRGFEEWDLAGDPNVELDLARTRVAERLGAWLTAEDAGPARERATELLARFGSGELWQRWLAIRPSIVARELPLLLPAAQGDDAIDFLGGTIDLLYRDPDDGAWVIADFKTDRLDSSDALEARIEVYSAQEEIYVEAVRQALELEQPPRAELWFLWPDHLWRTS
ncbi:MAG: UvrD-helicase domain-containing protein [Acidobacteria bacterium]|nr:UvrD-helicase domain-containing protein [Acidobacteriota bacterium]